MRTAISNLYKLITILWPYVGPILGLWTIALAVDAGFEKLEKFATLASHYILVPRRLWLVLAVLFFYFAYVEIRHRRTPLVVLSTDMTLTLETVSGDRATLHRVQRIRAYQHNVTGLYRWFGVDQPGRIPKDKIECNISHDPDKKEPPYFEGNEQGWQFIHRFPPIPRDLLRLGLNTIERTEAIVLLDAYTKPQEFFTLIISEHYQHKRVSVTVRFHPMRTCRLEDCEALRIHANGITKMALRHLAANEVRLDIKNPIAGERFKIIWTYPPLPLPQPAVH